MVAALSQLHHGVDQVGHVGLAGSFSQEREVLLEDGAVVFLLNVGELHLDDGFLFRSQLLLHVLLQPTQHHRLQDALKLLYLWAANTQRLKMKKRRRTYRCTFSARAREFSHSRVESNFTVFNQNKRSSFLIARGNAFDAEPRLQKAKSLCLQNRIAA